MQIKLAEPAGFCFGVQRAVNQTINEAKKGKVITYGSIINNNIVTREMESLGISIIENLDQAVDGTLIIRSHGVSPDIYKQINKKNIRYKDCTCPFVSKIHRLIEREKAKCAKIIILGNPKHPEIVGINGYASNEAIVLQSLQEAETAIFEKEHVYSVVAQTTFNISLFKAITKILKKRINNVIIYNTICDATKKRQEEADRLSKEVDIMIVLGDPISSNSVKLYEICKNNLEKTFFVTTIKDLVLNIFNYNDRIGITAGASTPPAIIKEALITMSELNQSLENEAINESEVNTQTFEELLEQNGSLMTLHTGAIVKGTVISVANGEVSVNLGFKSDGIIQKGEFAEDQTIDPAEVVKKGDEVEVFVVRVNDKEGNVLLSRRRIESQKGMAEIEKAAENGTILRGKISEVVKGGVIALIKGTRAFVPSSQVSNRYIENLETFVGQEFDFNILQFEKAKRRIVAGRKELAAKEVLEKKEKIFGSIEIGQKLDGTVSRIVDFGAFVDIGGIDGLIHISELSWGRVKKVTNVLKEGDKVVVRVIDVDKEKEKISLSLKDIANDPWHNVEEKYPVDSIITGKVVRMVPFGAFVEIAEGLDGLVHISQISNKHIAKPEDALIIGQMIDVKVTDINVENKKISLSKKLADDTGVDVEAYTDKEVDTTEEEAQFVETPNEGN